MTTDKCAGKNILQVIGKTYIIVQHEGDHICTARSIYETSIISELESYFGLDGLITPFEAIVNHLNRKLNFQDAQQAIQDLVKASLRKWNIKNLEARTKMKMNTQGPTLKVGCQLTFNLNKISQ